jgi:hypothetical protein
MLGATIGAAGASLLVLGFLFLLISNGVVSAVFGYTASPTSAVLMELLGIFVASVGAGMLIYGVLSRGPKQEETSTPEPS